MLWQHNPKHAEKLEENYHQMSVSIGESWGPCQDLGEMSERAIVLASAQSVRFEKKHSHPVSTPLIQIAIRELEIKTTHMQQSTSLFFIPPEFFYYVHSAQLCQLAVQGLWLTLGHKPQAEKRTEGEACLEVTLCGV